MVNTESQFAETVSRVTASLPAALAGTALIERLQSLSRPPARGDIVKIAGLLQRCGFIGAAETLFVSLVVQDPQTPAGRAGLAQLAMRKQQWQRAAELWQGLIIAFPGSTNGQWLATRAQALEQCGDIDQANAILQGLSQTHPAHPFQAVARANAAMRFRLWRDALSFWDHLLATFPQDPAIPHWQTAKASALAQLRHHTEAEIILRQILSDDPWMCPALQVLMRNLNAAGEPVRALQAVQESLFGDAQLPALFSLTLNALVAAQDFAAARAAFAAFLRHAPDLSALEMLFAEAPRLHDGWRLTEIRIDILRRLDALRGPDNADDATDHEVLRAGLKLSLKDYTGFQKSAGRIGTRPASDRHGNLRAAAARLAAPEFPDFGAVKIFGIGLSRTGTTSLAAALRALGFATLHWTNPITRELISDADLYLFDAFTDTPVCNSFEKYFHLFPKAKFIYTQRPIEPWNKSFSRHMRRAHNVSDFLHARDIFTKNGEFHYGTYFRELQWSLYFQYASPTSAYLAHDRRVREFFQGRQADRFLEFDVFSGDGWQKLCKFLDSPIPDIVFPHENLGTQ